MRQCIMMQKQSKMTLFLRLAVLSGVLGATASCLAKFAFAPDSPIVLWTKEICMQHVGSAVSLRGHDTCDLLALAPRGICLLCMVLLNILMVGTFLEGMEESGSVAGTALASAASFGTSALCGVLFFNEKVNTTWLFGFGLVVIGASMLSTVKLSEIDTGSEKKKEQ